MDNEEYYMQFTGAGLSSSQVMKLEKTFSDIREAYYAPDERLIELFAKTPDNTADEDDEPQDKDEGNAVTKAGRKKKDDINTGKECEGEKGVFAIRRFLEQRTERDPQKDYEKLQTEGIGYISMRHPDYPERLKNITGRPSGLFFKGTLPSDHTPAVAVVGSRDCSNYGREMAVKLAKGLAGAGIDIVSGMAAGIDGFAHRGALNAVPASYKTGGAGQTFAVLGCGVDICYPRSNHDIYSRIIETGGIISEYYPGTQPVSYNFPHRNRIISGLADAVLVVEARHKSGSWITVDFGLEQGKDIYAVPGRVSDRLSTGCNNLIKLGAKLVTCEEDIIKELAPKYLIKGRKKKVKLPEPEDEGQRKVLKALEIMPLSVGEIALKCGLPAPKTLSILSVLEIEGRAARIGASYVRISKAE